MERDLQAYGAPSIPLVPPFTVVYSTVRTCLTVRDRCVSTSSSTNRCPVRQGEDGRSILLHVLPDTDSRQPARPSGR